MGAELEAAACTRSSFAPAMRPVSLMGRERSSFTPLRLEAVFVSAGLGGGSAWTSQVYYFRINVEGCSIPKPLHASVRISLSDLPGVVLITNRLWL